jgi:hypothetical protein
MKKAYWYIRFGVVAFVLAGEVFGFFFLNQKIMQSLSHHEEQRVRTSVDQEQIANLPALKELQKRALAEESRFALVYPQSQAVEIIRRIETLAKNENVALTITQKEALPKKQPVKPVPSGGSTTATETKTAQNKVPDVPKISDKLAFENMVHLSLEARGEYKSVRNFLHKLENVPYAIDVLGVDMSVAPEDTEKKDVVNTTNQPGNIDSPFLLDSVSEPTAPVAPTVTPEEVVASIDTLLYIQ